MDLKKRVIKREKDNFFIGLNPSKANSVKNDRTLIRVINFCSRWNYRNLYVINLFGLISSSPSELSKTSDPVGKKNDLIILKVLKYWRENISYDLWLGLSDKGKLYNRDSEILKLIKNLSNLKLSKNNHSQRIFSLGLSKKGNPPHPLYIPSDSFLKNFQL